MVKLMQQFTSIAGDDVIIDAIFTSHLSRLNNGPLNCFPIWSQKISVLTLHYQAYISNWKLQLLL